MRQTLFGKTSTAHQKRQASDELPLMSGTKESNIVFIFSDLYHLGRPVAETFLLRKH